MSFTRTQPSAAYEATLEQYRLMHEKRGRYPGLSLLPHVERIRRLVEETGARTLLDYGAGKGMLYKAAALVLPDGSITTSVCKYWGVKSVRRYDPAFRLMAKLPTGQFDGVICTDVLEHIPEDDVGWVVDEIFGFARRFVFASVAAYPARTILPNGENAHCTIKPARWWRQLFNDSRRPGVLWRLEVIEAPEPR